IEEETEAEEAAKGPVEIKIKTPPRAERPDPKAGFGALFSSGLGLFLMVLLYAANVYGAFEIAIFKARPPLLVCGLSAVAPLVGPLIFLLLPRWTPEEDEEMAGEEAAEEGDHAPVFQTPGMARAQAAASAHAPAAPAGAGGPPPSQVFLRGQFTFNRRFFETKLAGFMRVVPSEAEKDMVLHVKSARGEHVASRIARVTPNDVALQITKGGASAEVVVPFAEISEVRVQHKDA
ncbi:MAG TPA: hypothetical protein VNO52_19050, partial [Methylomirabilota bacterium]|nr:hypothetical protein [Methylomirabilota bacterium]